MATLVAYDEPTERLVRLVEDTPPEGIVAAACARLREGAPPRDLLAAAGLAVSRSTELPPSHHGGPVHPVAGIQPLSRLAMRLDGADAMLPAVQSVALANKHVHAPEMGPGAMPEIRLDGLAGKTKGELLEGLAFELGRRRAAAAERCLLALLEAGAAPGAIMEALLAAALPRNALDDHYFLYLVYAFRALDDIGWRHAATILRPPVRFLARHPMMDPPDTERGAIVRDGIALYRNYAALEALVDGRALANGEPPFETDAAETGAVNALADAIAFAERSVEAPELAADALAGGMSVMGVCEAQSVGAARRFLRSNTGNPFDVHYLTGMNARRYLMRLPGLALRTRLLALLSWGQGYEVRHLDRTMRWPAGPDEEALAALPRRGPEELLDAVAESIAAQPEYDLRTLEGSIADLIAPDSVRETDALAADYVRRGYDAEAFMKRMAELVCRDDQSEMHAYKMQQAAFEEYEAARETLRGVHLAAAARHAASAARMRPRTVWPAARAALDA